MQKKWLGFTLMLALTGNALGVCAQETKMRRQGPPPPQVERDVIIERQGPEGPPPPGEGIGIYADNFVFVSTEMSYNGKLVKGAPYSAQAVTESVQSLSDGNRIVHKNSAQVYRDSEGRTRRDQSLGSIGPYAAAGDPPQTIFINDPVAGANYILDPRSKTARKLPRMEFHYKTGDGADKVIIERKLSGSGENAPHVRDRKEGGKESEGFAFTMQTPPPGAPPAPPDVQFYRHPSKAESKTEKLDSRNIEGVMAEGKRTTTTIAAGEIGNEQPIQIVNEEWYSPELQVIVMTRRSDPRMGETTYKLTNIQRGEPSTTLFQVPSDYTIKESRGSGSGGQIRMRRPAPPPSPVEN